MWNALQVGTYNGSSLQTLKMLVHEKGNEVLKVRDGDGKTLLHLAVTGKNQGMPVSMELIRYLVKEYPDATKIADKDGNLPMDNDSFLELFFYLRTQLDKTTVSYTAPRD
jgi:ankyrin repeat protein